MEAEWQDPEIKPDEHYMAEINVYANNRTGLLVDISKIFTERKIDIRNINCRTNKQEKATISVSFNVSCKDELNSLIEKIRQLAGKVLLDIALKCRAPRIELAALFGIDMAVREHAVKGVHGTQRHGVADHKQIVGAIGEAVVVLVGVVGRLLVGGCGVLGFPVQNFGALAAQRGRLGHKDQAAQCNDQHDSAGCADRDVRACPVGGRGGAIAEFGNGAPKGALPKRRLDKAI